MSSYYSAQDNLGRAQYAQAILRLYSGFTQALLRLYLGSVRACSPSAQVGSPSAQVKAAATHIQRLNQN
jgi:hypothetical protein